MQISGRQMKRIEAIIQSDKVGAVADALEGKVGGFVVLEGRGRGSGARPTVRMGRGTSSMTAEYNKVASIMTLVDDSQVDTAVSAIADAAYSGKAGDGIISITSVDEVVNIASKKRGAEAL